MKNTVYFDNAATTFPKPESVYRKTEFYVRNHAGNPGRGSHRLSFSASEAVYSARIATSELFGAESERVSFTLNTTYALNQAIKSVICEGSHVLISNMEHNSVLRPVTAACKITGSSYSVFEVSEDDEETLKNIENLISENTCAIICTHMSNIVPVILPIEKIGLFCRQNGFTFIVDGAQSAGVLPIDMKRDNIDILCVPGHKGLYGYQGCGAMIFGSETEEKINTLIEGGSGTDSIPIEMPDYLPDRFEAGTLPAPAIVSLGEGAKWVMSRGVDNIFEHDKRLCGYIMDRLGEYGKDVTVYNQNAGPTLLFNIGALPSSRAASLYNEHGICVRSGLHCAPLAHRTVGTFPYGAVRASFGAFNTMGDAKYFCDVTKRIIKENL